MAKDANETQIYLIASTLWMNVINANLYISLYLFICRGLFPDNVDKNACEVYGQYNLSLTGNRSRK